MKTPLLKQPWVYLWGYVLYVSQYNCTQYHISEIPQPHSIWWQRSRFFADHGYGSWYVCSVSVCQIFISSLCHMWSIMMMTLSLSLPLPSPLFLSPPGNLFLTGLARLAVEWTNSSILNWANALVTPIPYSQPSDVCMSTHDVYGMMDDICLSNWYVLVGRVSVGTTFEWNYLLKRSPTATCCFGW